ncbi:MAG: hypothetical protein E7Z77_02290 [Methanobrevibacter sp.]|uniref:hypothetical protein n=1 Tax=Methanobrevibacter sp. TaxID=66852 RepID=UPI0025CE1736|nr:hypothetical protein [Methanobrevibacter sp.]MBE6508223.1 hypothetical protein [Methanobrevibacter sp.]
MKNMNTESLLQTYFLEKNSSANTQRIYKKVVSLFEEHTQKTLTEIINIAEAEEQKVKWQKSTLYHCLISFRKHLYERFQPSTAKMYFTVIKAIIKHFDINILPLKGFSTTKYQKVELTPEDIITQEELKLCVEVKNPLVKASSITMAQMGFALIDLLNLTIMDYYNSTSEYHSNPRNVNEMIHELNQAEDVVPIFKKLTRQKTGRQYDAIGSPEVVKAINNYLLYREKKEKESIERYNKKHPANPKIYPGLQLTDPLFKTNHGSLERMFREVNDAVGLGKAGNYVKFSPHMMRRFHATQLHEAGMSEHKINLLQGRKPQEVIHKSYLRVRLDVLRDEYIQCLPFLLVDDVNRVKSELDLIKDENVSLREENFKYKSMFDEIDSRLQKLEGRRSSGFDVDEFDDVI